MTEFLPVGMGEVRVSKSPDILAVYGIGSCVVVIMYDRKKKIGGIAHIMLSDSTGDNTETNNLSKYADRGIKELLNLLLKEGASKRNIIAEIVGGSEMFSTTGDFENSVGCDNIRSVKSNLNKLNIELVSENIGGRKGRSVEFDLQTGIMNVSLLGEENKEM